MALHRNPPKCFSPGPAGRAAADGMRAARSLDALRSGPAAGRAILPACASGADEESSAERRLLERAIAGVMRNAQGGELPLFAWTLGLPQDVLLQMSRQCFPEIGVLERMPRERYRKLAAALPADFYALVGVLLDGRSPGRDGHAPRWLAHAVAAACHGARSLRENLGLADEHELSRLLACYFHPLHQRKARDRCWKHFLLAESRAMQDAARRDSPACGTCAPEPLSSTGS